MWIGGFDRCDMLNVPRESKPAFTIFFAGCTVHCHGCHNEKLWTRACGDKYMPCEIVELINKQPIKYDSVVLLGGEPMEQPLDDLQVLCGILHDRGYHVWLYTSYELYMIPEPILQYLYIVKTGKYEENLKLEDNILASSNQKFWVREGYGIWRSKDEHWYET